MKKTMGIFWTLILSTPPALSMEDVKEDPTKQPSGMGAWESMAMNPIEVTPTIIYHDTSGGW